MNQFNTRATVLRTNTNHDIKCTGSDEKRLVCGLNSLLDQGTLSQAEVRAVVASLPASFLANNHFDSVDQYVRLLWNALQDADLQVTERASVTNIANFHAPVHTQILQTGPRSQAQILQKSQYNQAFSEKMLRMLEEISSSLHDEIANESERSTALIVVEEAKIESAKTQPDAGKLRKTLLRLGKWTGERFSNAVDAAIECAINYGAKGGG